MEVVESIMYSSSSSGKNTDSPFIVVFVGGGGMMMIEWVKGGGWVLQREYLREGFVTDGTSGIRNRGFSGWREIGRGFFFGFDSYGENGKVGIEMDGGTDGW